MRQKQHKIILWCKKKTLKILDANVNIKILDGNVNNTVISNLDETNNNSKCLIGYLDEFKTISFGIA